MAVCMHCVHAGMRAWHVCASGGCVLWAAGVWFEGKGSEATRSAGEAYVALSVGNVDVDVLYLCDRLDKLLYLARTQPEHLRHRTPRPPVT